ncbi:MAG: hypothetical protein LBR25_01255 [Erysipelotrichaceae bacterium]|jgi:hypothetical protein|nr:hypothetical protein [Erysipelotrichaceae bacterium]
MRKVIVVLVTLCVSFGLLCSQISASSLLYAIIPTGVQDMVPYYALAMGIAAILVVIIVLVTKKRKQ